MGPNITTISHPNICHHIARNYFDFLYIIGRGGFGKVWKVQLKQKTKYYALKEMSKLKIIDKKSENSIMSERDLLSVMNHSFIVNMSYGFQDHENLYLVMDLLTGGDLRYQLFKYKTFTEGITRFFIACIILGLEYIHSKKIIHRDIKPENLVCDKDGYVRITDFGVAKAYQQNNGFETSGTPGYMAPEVLFHQNHSYQVDYFAIGVIAYEFMFGLRPYLGRCRKDIKDLVYNKQVQIKEEDVLPGWSNESADFINKLLLRKPSQRLGNNGIDELKNHAWMKSVNWDQLLQHKLPSPFIPEQTDNFDKKYCEVRERIGEETFHRYQEYVKSPDYIYIFNKYNFIPKITLIKEESKKEKKIQMMNTASSIKLSKGTSTRASFNESLTPLFKGDSYKISNHHNFTSYNRRSKDKDKDKYKTKAANTSNLLLGKSMSMRSINNLFRKTISVINSNKDILNSNSNKHYSNNKGVTNRISQIQLSDHNIYPTKRGKDKRLSPYKTLDIGKSLELSNSKSPTSKEKDRDINSMRDKFKNSMSRNNNNNKNLRSLYGIKYSQNLPLLSFVSLSPIFNHESNTISNKPNLIINHNNKKSNKSNHSQNHKRNKNVFKQTQRTITKPITKPQYETIQPFHQGTDLQGSRGHAKYFSPLLVSNSRNGN